MGAVLIAVAITAVGAGIDARSTDELGATFKFFLVGCVAAALLVRRRALFTAAAQPPLVAFGVGIITLYTVNADCSTASLKSLILQVLLPIADVFPWLAITFLKDAGAGGGPLVRHQTTGRGAGTGAKDSSPAKDSSQTGSKDGARARSSRRLGKRPDTPDASEPTSGEQPVVVPPGRGRGRRHVHGPGGDRTGTSRPH